MKQISSFLLLISTLFFSVLSVSIAQVINGDVTLSSQAEINSFVGTSINGNFTIDGADITDLTPLLTLVSIESSLFIQTNTALTNLDGLSGITSIGSDLTIESNFALTDLNGLSSITAVGGGMRIVSNSAITNLDGLSNITSVGGDLNIGYNSVLTDLDGLSGIVSIDDLGIISNSALTNLDGLSSITSVGSMSIQNNEVLTNIDGLGSIASVDGGLFIYHNSALTNLDGLGGITSVGYLHIDGNSALTNLDGLSSITAVNSNLDIVGNNSLYSFCGLYLLLNSGGLQDSYNVYSNLINPTQEEIINAGPCTTSIEVAESDLAPKKYELQQNYPNPFNPNTTISYSLPQSGFVQLKVYDMLGCEVANLVNEEQAIGNYKIEFIASNLSSGVYFYRLQSGGYVETKKLILLR